MNALLEATGLVKEYEVRHGFWQRGGGRVRALAGVDLRLERGETLALVGESGSGKTTLGRCLLLLLEPTAGSVRFRGENLMTLPREEMRRRRRYLQMIFQDSLASLDPRMRVGESVAEPLDAHDIGTRPSRRRRVQELLELVGLPGESAARFPHEFSGGQRQRIGIARALAAEPELVVADEPVSALDVSVRGQVLDVLAELRARLGLALLLISHDLGVVERLADRVAVLYLGRIAEQGPAGAVFRAPQHPYTVSLLSAIPRPIPGAGRRRIVLAGEMPSPADPPSGCLFHPRCPIARDRCRTDSPPLVEVGPGHLAACHYAGELVL